MTVETIFCDNYFPPTVIVCSCYNGQFFNETNYRIPRSGKYDESVFGIWKVTYKKLNPNYYTEGQLKTAKP